jgi:hypothetical protein
MLRTTHVIHIARTDTGETDVYGNTVYTEVSTEYDIVTWPWDGNGTGGNEDIRGRDQVTSGLTLSMPADASVSPVDQFIVRGQKYEVVGRPEPYLFPWANWDPGLPVAVSLVEG